MFSHEKNKSDGADKLVRDKHGQTVLHRAVQSDSDFIFISDLIFPDLLEATDNNNHTPLQCAVMAGSNQWVRALIAKGANTTIVDADQRNLLHLAVDQPAIGRVIKIDLILNMIQSGCDVNAKDKNGNTPLHAACYWNDVDLIECLLANGANLDVQNEKRKMKTPFHDLAYANLNGGNRYVDTIITVMKFGPNTQLRDSDGKSALELLQERHSGVCDSLKDKMFIFQEYMLYKGESRYIKFFRSRENQLRPDLDKGYCSIRRFFEYGENSSSEFLPKLEYLQKAIETRLLIFLYPDKFANEIEEINFCASVAMYLAEHPYMSEQEKTYLKNMINTKWVHFDRNEFNEKQYTYYSNLPDYFKNHPGSTFALEVEAKAKQILSSQSMKLTHGYGS